MAAIEVRGLLKPEAHFLLVEPNLHVSAKKFQRTVEIAYATGMKPCSEPKARLYFLHCVNGVIVQSDVSVRKVSSGLICLCSKSINLFFFNELENLLLSKLNNHYCPYSINLS